MITLRMDSLLDAYKDPLRTSRNPVTLAKRAGVSLAAAKSFLRDREEAQVRRRAARLKNATYAPTGDERGVWIGDLERRRARRTSLRNRTRTCGQLKFTLL